MNVADLRSDRTLVDQEVDLQGILVSDGEQCWLEDETMEQSKRILLAKNDLFGLIGRQVSIIVGGRYPIYYPAEVSGTASLQGSETVLTELSSIVVSTNRGKIDIDLSDGAGEYDLVFD